jgi:peroxiredoxin
MQRTSRRLEIGTAAPDIAVVNADGQRLNLSALWSRKRTILSFLRHFG